MENNANPKGIAMTEHMNAFHPKFMATFYPNFWDVNKSQQALTAEREAAKKKKDTKPRQFYVFAKAIMPPKRNYARL
jgi:hypothetical protein